MKLFSNDLTGRFLERPNRFSVLIETSSGRVHAHCSNPGRMGELLLPGATVILEHSPGTHRKTEWTLAAVKQSGKIIPLVSSRANRVASELILPRLFPEAIRYHPEYSIEHFPSSPGQKSRIEVFQARQPERGMKKPRSRFDFLVDFPENRQALVEVKSCTLSFRGRAMFPDAPTDRGRRHVEELERIASPAFDSPLDMETVPAGRKFEGHVIFVLYHPDAELFTPNIHTDPAFSSSLEKASGTVHLHAVSIGCSESGECRIIRTGIPFDFKPLEHIRADRGIYILELMLESDTVLKVGKLGAVSFQAGFYLYAGSAKRNLSKRTARHLRRERKKLHWHIDYLREAAEKAAVYPIYTADEAECELAGRIGKLGGIPVPRFGSSDCRCHSHLFYFRNPPEKTVEFQNLLLDFRHRRI